jgi:hypothetical protein
VDQQAQQAMNGNLKPFLPGVLDLPPLDQFVDQYAGLSSAATREVLAGVYRHMQTQDVWLNDEYQVNVTKDSPHGFPDTTIWHLAIKRRDRESVHDWRDLQAIKNAIVGPEYEGIELYPAESRLMDTANSYHLFVFVQSGDRMMPQIPIGWTERTVSETAEAAAFGAKQRERTGDQNGKP